MSSSSVSSSQGSKHGDSREIPVQNDIWFVKETDRYQDYLGDVAEETERVHSGYYLDVREGLDTCMRYYDYMENPFYKVHVGAMKYLHRQRKQAHKHSVFSEDESSSEHSTSFIESSPDSSVHIESPGLLNKVMGESIINKSYAGRKRLDSDVMSGIGLLSPSISANTTINDLGPSLPDHMDNVSVEMSRMKPEELSGLINNSTLVNESVANDCTNKLLCYETLGSSSPDVESADSTASTTVSQREISAATALCYLNKRYVREFDSSDSSSNVDVYEYKDCRSPSRYQFTCHN